MALPQNTAVCHVLPASDPGGDGGSSTTSSTVAGGAAASSGSSSSGSSPSTPDGALPPSLVQALGHALWQVHSPHSRMSPASWQRQACEAVPATPRSHQSVVSSGASSLTNGCAVAFADFLHHRDCCSPHSECYGPAGSIICTVAVAGQTQPKPPLSFTAM